MHTARVTLRSTSPYSPSRAYDHEIPKLPGEKPDAYEERTWRNKAHTNSAGNIYMPPMAFKMGLDTAAQRIGRQIPGKGKATYTKYFLSGVLMFEGPVLPIKAAELTENECDRIHANSDGVRGSGKRVWRLFPRIDDWEVDVEYTILTDEIEQDVFEEALHHAASFVGVGRFRPQNGGYYGRYEVVKCHWS